MITDQKKNLESTLRCFLEEPKGREFLQSLDEAKICAISDQLVRENTFRDLELLDKTIYCVWGDHSIQKFISHSLWCAHREAIWRTPDLNGESCRPDFDIIGIEHLHHTKNQATIVISPITLCTDDAMEAILMAFQKHQPDRRFVCYGENMESYLERNPEYKSIFAENTVSGIRKILRVLQEGGIFLTYPDFVYKEHNAIHGKLFGTPRAFSAGLLKIAIRSRALFLPTITKRKSKTIEIRFFESIAQPKEEKNSSHDNKLQEQVLTIVIGKLLEALILQVPHQWRLLPTISHEAPEMA